MNLKDENPPTRLGLEDVLLHYYQAADAGNPLAPDDLLAVHPHLAEELKAFFAGEAALRHLPADDLEGQAATTPGPCAVKQVTIVEAPPDLGGVVLEGELGRGGIGIVYRVRDPQLGRGLAVKVLRSKYLDDADARTRFVEEAQIGGQLQHPGIVPVHGLGTLPDGRPYFTMKLVRGQTLAALLAQRASPLDELPSFLGIFDQICQTVGYAHSQGVIHRDLKPGNVMVGAFGEV
jgi:hypothetical protein